MNSLQINVRRRKMNYKVAAIIVTYNKPELLKRCLNSVLKQTYLCDNVILIDNGGFETTQSIVDLFKQHFSNLHHVNTGENLGGAGGFFKGIIESLDYNPDFLWILDDDTVPNFDALENLVLAFNKINEQNKKVGFLASEVRWTDGSLAIMNVPRFFKNKEKSAGYERLVSSSFVSMLVSAEAVKALGLPIPEFFIWGDDAEYSRRISEKYPSYYVSESQVVHLMNDNIGPNVIKERDINKLDRYFYEFRNRIYIVRKFDKKILLVEKVLKNLAIAFVSLTKKKGLKRFKIVLKGTYEGFLFNPQVRFFNEDIQK